MAVFPLREIHDLTFLVVTVRCCSQLEFTFVYLYGWLALAIVAVGNINKKSSLLRRINEFVVKEEQ